MADIKKKLPENVDGEFFVDSTCDNFDICRQLAPETFMDSGRYAYVGRQPQSDEQRRRALHALVSCPKGSIGKLSNSSIKEVFDDFPLLLEDDVHFCGFNTIKSAGANSYFIAHPQGGWLVATPKFVPALTERLAARGGVRYIFISHRDDVGEAKKYAEFFNATVIIHELELDAFPDATTVLQGMEEIQFLSDFRIVPTPGHTEGHCMLLYKNKFLFSGDTLRFNRQSENVEIWNPYWTWYSYTEQVSSVERLLALNFEWILTSHGQRVKLDAQEMRRQIAAAVQSARQEPEVEPRDAQRIKNLQYYIAELRRYGQPVYADKIQEKLEMIIGSIAVSTAD